MTKAYREANPGKTQCTFVGANILRKLLEQPNSQGIRFYFALNGETTSLVAVSANEQEDDLIGDGYLVADEGTSGPPTMGISNVLNS
ncbi:hypothetical protein KCG47_16840 [Microvirga sp. SRT04]|nr:hypothetical protein [Microvirga sp. SRT04]